MSDKLIYGVTALFDTPDDLINSAKAVVKDGGYKKFDVHSSYPIHGMPKAMGQAASKLGYFALAFGLSGTLIAFLFVTWSMTIAYPLTIGGKPFFSLPAFIPVIFEVTVLLASLGAVFSMLFILFKFPNNSHPLHDTDYMKKISVDAYGICIEAKDKNFDEEKVRDFFAKLGGKEITTIYYDIEEVGHKHKVFEPKFMIFLVCAFIVTSGATYFTLNKLMYMAPFDWMLYQNRIDAQDASMFFADGFGMREPVEGTVARNQMPYPYKGQPELAVNLVNPIEATKASMELGQKKFNTFCSPCHGYFGKGDGRLNGQFPTPPSLLSEKIRGWKDGQIFHVITEGQNSMPSYAKQALPEERWAIVNYVRAIQRATNAKEGDLK